MKVLGLIIGIGIMIFLTGSVFAVVMQQSVNVEVLPGDITVYSPVNNMVYNSRMVPINITMSENATFRYAKYSDNGNPFITLCRDCTNYGFDNLKKKPFTEGPHKIRIVAVFEDGEIDGFVDLVIDSRNPRIKSTFPKKGFSNGFFKIKFEEVNLDGVFFNHGNDEVGFRVEELNIKDDCFFKKNDYICEVNVPLEDYNNHEIKYWFEVKDISGKSSVSKITNIKVDNLKPMVDFNFDVEGNRVRFKFDVEEPNFNKVEYLYSNGWWPWPWWKKICSRLDDGHCEMVKGFKKGTHEIDFKISDKAGNVEFIEGVRFEVV